MDIVDVGQVAMLRVVIVSHAYNGPGRLAPLAAVFSGHEVVVVAPRSHSDGNAESGHFASGLTVSPVKTVGFGRMQYVMWGLAGRLRATRPDVICVEYDPWHIQTINVLVSRCIAGSRASVVLLVKKNTFRDRNAPVGRLKRAIAARVLDLTSGVIFASRMTLELYEELFSAHLPRHISVQPHLAVDTARFTNASKVESRDQVRIGYVGKLTNLKGLPDLLEAFGALKGDPGLNVSLTIVGSDPDEGIARENMAGVDWRGQVDNSELERLLQDIDVFVMPSRIFPDHQEHDGRAVLEAMAAGIPVVVSDSGILPEIVSCDEGMVFPAGDVNALATALGELCVSPRLRVEMGRRGRARAVAMVSPDAVRGGRVQLFQEMLGNTMDEDDVRYTARREYLSEDVASGYMTRRFSGPLGRYKFVREQRAVDAIIDEIPASDIGSILDCPTGIGRWLPNLARLNPDKVFAADVSPTMLKHARLAALQGVEVSFGEAVAEDLPFQDGAFDLVFCHALLKHLPSEAQAAVVKELARVSARYVVVTASVKIGIPGYIRKFRKAAGSHALDKDAFADIVREAGLLVTKSRKATTPVGVETCFLLERAERREVSR